MRIGGLVVARQRPGTAKGIVFILLEDEFGTVNLIVPPPVYERHRLIVRIEPLIMAEGRLERLPQAGGAINVYVRELRPLVAPERRRGRRRRARRAAGGSRQPQPPRASDFRGVAPAVQSFASGRRR